jgi:hypothetical protein
MVTAAPCAGCKPAATAITDAPDNNFTERLRMALPLAEESLAFLRENGAAPLPP